MAFTKIEALDHLIADLPDRIQNQPEWLKAYFDGNALALQAALNSLIDELKAGTAADQIGVVPEGDLNAQTVQAALSELAEKIGTGGGHAQADWNQLDPEAPDYIKNKPASLKGDKGDPGEKGDPFTYDDFTPEQLAALKGEKGDKGDPGTPGTPGEKGDKGDKGDPGEKGETGAPGAAGAPGADGQNASITGVTATVDAGIGTPYVEVVVGGTAQNRSFELQFHNLKGEKGESGTGGGGSGEPGEDGGYYTPSVTNGTLSWAASKTGMPSVPSAYIKGDKGDKGDQGEQGVQGIQGETGAQGPQGIQGIQGIQGEKGDKGDTGARGGRFLPISTYPDIYTTAVGDITPSFRIAAETVLSESGADSVLAGDVLQRNYYMFPVIYVDAQWCYLDARCNIRGTQGAAGNDGAAGAPGADGGYYEPSVTDGTLSWTASKAAMPSIPSAYIKGDPGESGVAVRKTALDSPLEDNTRYTLSGANSITLTYPSGNFACSVYVTFGSSGASVSFPSSTKYIGDVPTFTRSKAYEISIVDGVAIIGEVG